MGFAAQRFTTVADVFRLLSVRVSAVIECLIAIRAESAASSGWAAFLLDEAGKGASSIAPRFCLSGPHGRKHGAHVAHCRVDLQRGPVHSQLGRHGPGTAAQPPECCESLGTLGSEHEDPSAGAATCNSLWPP